MIGFNSILLKLTFPTKVNDVLSLVILYLFILFSSNNIVELEVSLEVNQVLRRCYEQVLCTFVYTVNSKSNKTS